MDKRNKENVIVVSTQELATIELEAIKAPTKNGSLTPRIVRKFLEHITNTYGIDLGIVTEDMENERIEREAKEDRKRSRQSRQLGRKSSRSSADDF